MSKMLFSMSGDGGDFVVPLGFTVSRPESDRLVASSRPRKYVSMDFNLLPSTST